jgi:FKBP-type peptidyl-prolyl cis-trans isomerase
VHVVIVRSDLVTALITGLMGMRAGGERQLLVPPHLGKGKTKVDNLGEHESFFLCK